LAGDAVKAALRASRRIPIVRRSMEPATMTQTSNRIFDEMARLMGDAANVAQGVRREAETMFRTQMERFVADMDLVKREDFDVVREMASKARAENVELKKRVAELEKALGEKPKRAPRQAKPKET
jgi:BMFP domain-containing protein YqiC